MLETTELRSKLECRADSIRQQIQVGQPLGIPEMGATMELLRKAAGALAAQAQSPDVLRERIARALHAIDCEEDAPDDGSETADMYAEWWESNRCNRALYYRRADRVIAAMFHRMPDAQCMCGHKRSLHAYHGEDAPGECHHSFCECPGFVPVSPERMEG